MTAFTDAMDKLAAEIATAASGEDINLGDKIDAFKALVPYYAQQMKHKVSDNDDSEDDFASFQSRIHASENGHGERESGVRGGGRNGNGAEFDPSS